MREVLKNRLEELKQELETGRNVAIDLDARRTELEGSMLRIAGAVQVIEELLQAEPADAASGT